MEPWTPLPQLMAAGTLVPYQDPASISALRAALVGRNTDGALGQDHQKRLRKQGKGCQQVLRRPKAQREVERWRRGKMGRGGKGQAVPGRRASWLRCAGSGVHSILFLVPCLIGWLVVAQALEFTPTFFHLLCLIGWFGVEALGFTSSPSQHFLLCLRICSTNSITL